MIVRVADNGPEPRTVTPPSELLNGPHRLCACPLCNGGPMPTERP